MLGIQTTDGSCLIIFFSNNLNVVQKELKAYSACLL